MFVPGGYRCSLLSLLLLLLLVLLRLVMIWQANGPNIWHKHAPPMFLQTVPPNWGVPPPFSEDVRWDDRFPFFSCGAPSRNPWFCNGFRDLRKNTKKLSGFASVFL